MAALRGNAFGIDGIAPNTADRVAVRIMALRAVPGGDERDKDVANAIRYAADNGAHVVNMSFGKAYSPQKEAVDAAVRYALARGVLFVHAAGNDAKDLDVEPSFPTARLTDGTTAGAWLEVGASAETADALAAGFSNVGATRVDLFAPGAQVGTLARNGLTTVTDGTSFAAPVVAGVAALPDGLLPRALGRRDARDPARLGARPRRALGARAGPRHAGPLRGPLRHGRHRRRGGGRRARPGARRRLTRAIPAPYGPGERSPEPRVYPGPHQPASRMPTYNQGDKVEWNWGNGTGTGTVQESFTEPVTRTIQGTEVTRNADADNPAYLIEQDDGDRVLKSESELSKA